jgi:hypothetical protein
MPEVSGEAAAAKRNRERETRLEIVEALRRLAIPYNRWPDFVRAFYTDAGQQIQYHSRMTPLPYQSPEFDRLHQSEEEWLQLAYEGFLHHCQEFLQECRDWVSMGVDEPIGEPRRTRGRGKKGPTGGRRRAENTPLDGRFEWAAKYLLGERLKEIASADADPSTVGRVARECIRRAGWATRSRTKH